MVVCSVTGGVRVNLFEKVMLEQISEGGEEGVHARVWEEGANTGKGQCEGPVCSQMYNVATDHLRVQVRKGTVGTDGAGPCGCGGDFNFYPHSRGEPGRVLNKDMTWWLGQFLCLSALSLNHLSVLDLWRLWACSCALECWLLPCE